MDIHTSEQPDIILLKVPEYLFEHWERAAVEGGGAIIGHLEIPEEGSVLSASSAPSKKRVKKTAPSSSRLKMHVNTDAIEGLKGKTTEFTIAPRELTREHLEVVSRDAYGEMTVFGAVHFKADMKPVNNSQYRDMKKRRVVVSDASLVPIARADDASLSTGGSRLELKKKRAELQKQRQADAKLDREAKYHRKKMTPKELQQMLFRTFERSQFVTMRQFERETKEAKAVLQGALGPIAIFHRHGANRNSYELKEEFRTAKE